MEACDIIQKAVRDFTLAGIPSPHLDAELLLAFCLGYDRLEFFKNPALPVDENTRAKFEKLAARRRQWEPVAYLVGRKEFWSLVLDVNNAVLIPRPDTEVVVEEALKIAGKIGVAAVRILDIGTGSGALALALAKELKRAQIVATDISAAALAVAKRNAQKLALDGQIDFRQGNLFAPITGLFDIIVSNPPYIADEEYDQLPSGVKNYEPREALVAGRQGTAFYEKIISQAMNYLQKNGWLVLEIGAMQQEKIINIMDSSGYYEHISIRNDYAGLPRVVKARKKD